MSFDYGVLAKNSASGLLVAFGQAKFTSNIDVVPNYPKTSPAGETEWGWQLLQDGCFCSVMDLSLSVNLFASV